MEDLLKKKDELTKKSETVSSYIEEALKLHDEATNKLGEEIISLREALAKIRPGIVQDYSKIDEFEQDSAVRDLKLAKALKDQDDNYGSDLETKQAEIMQERSSNRVGLQKDIISVWKDREAANPSKKIITDEVENLETRMDSSFEDTKNKNKSLLEALGKEREINREIKNNQSLIDQYADPNLEMPSYMDPED